MASKTNLKKSSNYLDTLDLLNSFEKRKKAFYDRQKILESKNYKQLIYRIANKNNCQVTEITKNNIFGEETTFNIKIKDTNLVLHFSSKDLKSSNNFILSFNKQIKEYREKQAQKLVTLLNSGYSESNPLIKNLLSDYKSTISKAKEVKKEYKYFIRKWNEASASAYIKADSLLTAQELSLSTHPLEKITPSAKQQKSKQKQLIKKKIRQKEKAKTLQKILSPKKVNTITHTRKLTEEEILELLNKERGYSR